MAERRMFSKSVIGTDDFMDMSATAKVLYFYLMAEADDDGFVSKPKAVMRQIGAAQDDMGALLTRKYVIAFESGIIVIRHWKLHNYLRADRYKPTTYLNEKGCLDLVNGVYENNKAGLVYQMDTNGIQNVSIGKDSIGKDSIGKNKEINKEKVGFKKLITDYTQDTELLSTLFAFIEMRKAKKKPNTDRAVKLFLNKLDTLAKDNATKIAIVNQSIEHGWDSFYQLKDSVVVNKTPDNSWNVEQHGSSQEFLDSVRKQCEVGTNGG